uniref:BCNT-C domain-containing protein n=1 Tax=Trypanosoma congolense (strain IL3000) TaxID=1068625 RepID=G0UQZ7_TRYCI|nr:conserved hypothetical protein [Trypanosoma congolense IL3000]
MGSRSSSSDAATSSGNSSGEESSASSFTGRNSSSASSSSSSSQLSACSANNLVNVSKDCGDAIAVQRLEREQRLRRLISQRKVGSTVPVDDGKRTEPFTMRKGTLDSDDGIILSTFSNAILFERLLHVLSTSSSLARSQNFDEVLAVSNPLFYRNLKAPLPDAPADTPQDRYLPPRVHSECEQLDNSAIVVRRQKRERQRNRSTAGKDKSAASSATGPRVPSASTSIIVRSQNQWENYLSKELESEGVSLQSFRQKRQDDSYVEKQRFLERSQWAEYQHELQLEARQRELKANRSTRRGETDIN